VQRLKLEHPGEESTVVHRGRILGNLQPTRAFGDIKYKWPANALQNFLPSIMPDGIKARTMASNYLTPPYVTARPEVEYRKFSLPPPKNKAPPLDRPCDSSLWPLMDFGTRSRMRKLLFWQAPTSPGCVQKPLHELHFPKRFLNPPLPPNLKLTSPDGPNNSYLVYETTPQKEFQRRPSRKHSNRASKGTGHLLMTTLVHISYVMPLEAEISWL
jgi:hypothetical protein